MLAAAMGSGGRPQLLRCASRSPLYWPCFQPLQFTPLLLRCLFKEKYKFASLERSRVSISGATYIPSETLPQPWQGQWRNGVQVSLCSGK